MDTKKTLVMIMHVHNTIQIKISWIKFYNFNVESWHTFSSSHLETWVYLFVVQLI